MLFLERKDEGFGGNIHSEIPGYSPVPFYGTPTVYIAKSTD